MVCRDSRSGIFFSIFLGKGVMAGTWGEFKGDEGVRKFLDESGAICGLKVFLGARHGQEVDWKAGRG